MMRCSRPLSSVSSSLCSRAIVLNAELPHAAKPLQIALAIGHWRRAGTLDRFIDS